MPQRILCCPLATPGFLNPILGVALELTARGHDVAFAGGVLSELDARKHGFEFIADPPASAYFDIKSWSTPESLRGQKASTAAAIRNFAPDVVLASQLALGTLLACHLHSTPAVVMGLAAYLYPTARDDRPSRLVQRAERYVERARRTLADAFGNDVSECSSSALRRILNGDAFLLQSVPELVDARVVLPPEVHLVGACLLEPTSTDTALEQWLAPIERRRAKLAYVSVGRTFGGESPLPAIVGALSANGFCVAAATDRTDLPYSETSATKWIRPDVPQHRVLKSATVAISSGHTTSVLGALTAGVPLMLFPNGSGTHEIADAAEQAGVARVFANGEGVSEAVRHFIDGFETMRAQTEVIRASFAGIHSFANVSAIVAAFSRASRGV